MASTKISFINQDAIQLSARLELPVDQEVHTYAIFAHCFTCNKNLTAVKNISRALNQHGIGVLRFDFTGLGESEGDFEDTNFSSNVDDLIAASQYLTEHYEAPKIVIGHSLGGAAAIYAASRISSIEAVATIGAPSDPGHVSHLLHSKIDEINATGIAHVSIGGRGFTVKKQFLDDLENRQMQKILKELRKPLLVMHSPQDKTVGIYNAAEIYQAAHHPKSFITLDGADHLLTRKEDSRYVGQMIGSWVSRYITIPEPTVLETDHQAVVRTENDGYTTEIKVGQHHLIADEPAAVGGNNLGPTPYGLLLSSLGACTSMTLRMYADRKGWDLKEVIVHLNHGRVHSDDCASCESQQAKIDRFERKIELIGNLDETQRKRLMEIADKCPVHKTLHNQVEVVTTEAHPK